MTPEYCMTLSDTLNPNAVPDELKARWLSELEGRILVTVHGHDPEALAFRGEAGEELTLSVPFPFDRLYWLYLVAMTDFWNGDVSRYEETATLFDEALEDYAKWCKRERRY
ncbi:MAG: hypothetical protein IJW00_08855 [Clostridia bacterium]|nr:hypothetical protein [Clostridia bacterium]